MEISTETIKYIIEDEAIIELFGRQNFSNKESAVFEIIKNSYDAGSSWCQITFGEDYLCIADDGSGMDYKDITEKWMHVGRSEKGYKSSENDRVLAGSKGIGRFALARLGNVVSLYSYNGISSSILWETDWRSTTIQNDSRKNKGTTIHINKLRESWRKKDIFKLIDFLNRVVRTDDMKILLKWNNQEFKITPVMANMVLGVDYTQKFLLKFNSDLLKLNVQINNDEFRDEVKLIVDNKNINYYQEEINIYNEFKNLYNNENEFEENKSLEYLLKNLGSFTAEMYFGISPTKHDIEEFKYKYQKIEKENHHGIILYRNNFSIASYEGKRDWLGIESRVRKSPAAASSKNGAWRVRKNQITGFVVIDKNRNKNLEDLSNRQGLDENDYYELFIEIINHGISVFERYRQGIIRQLKSENEEREDIHKDKLDNFTLNKFLKKPNENFSKKEFEEIAKSVQNIKYNIEMHKRESKEIEEKFRYETRILNVLATQGLRASTLAHELHTHNNFISSVNSYIIKSLTKMGYWDSILEKSKVSRSYENIPRLLEKNNEINLTISKYVTTILKNVEKSSFIKEIESIEETLEDILHDWKNQYHKIKFILKVDENNYLKNNITYDTLAVIFDNLILNSLQNNEKKSKLTITITIKSKNNSLLVEYRDDGVGLSNKYQNNPERILEVHESSRKDGHGLGMWIVHTSILRTRGEVVNIKVGEGFGITFSVGGKYE